MEGPPRFAAFEAGGSQSAVNPACCSSGIFDGDKVPPGAVLLLLVGTIPVEGLKQDSHGWLLVRGWKEHSAKTVAREDGCDEKLVTKETFTS